MTRLTTFDLTPFYRNSVGLDRLFDRIVNQLDNSTQTSNYPPYDIIRFDDDHFEIRLAVAGFQQGEIDVQFHENQIIVTGEQTNERPEVNYVHNGISRRSFVRTWAVGDYVEVTQANVQDGILYISLERRVPEALKPKSIDITYSK